MKKVFWTLFVAMAGLVMARVVDPGTAQQVVGIITRMGVKDDLPLIYPRRRHLKNKSLYFEVK